MGDFFERPAHKDEPPAARPPSPPWVGPPAGVLPGVVGLELVLARNARAAVFVGRLAVYPTGVEFEVRVLSAGEDGLDPSLNGVYLHRRRPRADNYEDMLRFGVEFSDGQRATNIGGHRMRGGEPEGPVLWGRGGGGSDSQWEQTFWLWPLPPPGELMFVCEWPAAGLALARAGIEAQVVRDAASRAHVVFPGQSSEPEHSWSSTTFSVIRPGPEPPGSD